MCVYRQDLTASCEVTCVVGMFIPDEGYSEEVEGGGVDTLLSTSPWESTPGFYEWLVEHELLLTQLQSIHDDDASWTTETFSDEGSLQLESPYE